MQRKRLVLLLLTYISSANAFQYIDPSSPDSRSLLLRRDDVSCKAVDSRLPDNFTCPEGSNCISLDSGSSALCCPDGNTCSNIAPIPCDIQGQNATRNPNASIFTTKSGDNLPSCGSSCCPFGYACIDAPKNQQDGKPVCSLNTGSSKSGTSDTSPASSTTSSASSTQNSGSSSSLKTSTSKSPTSSSTSTSTAISGASSNSAQLENSCNKFPVTVFLAGLFPGMFIGAFMMLAWVICSGRHRKPPQRDSAGSSFYKPQISDPIPLQPGGLRTDFLRRTTGHARSMFSMASGQSPTTGTRENWKMPTPPVVNNIPPTTRGIPVPVTPDRRVPRSPDTESIKIYTPPSGPNIQPAMPAYPPNIAPLRGMNAQRYMDHGGSSSKGPNQNNIMGSPFETPPHTKSAANNKHSSFRASHHHANERTMSGAYSTVSSLHDHEVLTPARYDGTGGGEYTTITNRNRSASAGDKSRPTTGFTEMLHEAGFPDTYGQAPDVPKIPNGYESRR
ncbi:hypothetical protein LTR84_009253 [Exophiala bonariae]|uniref:Mid2 domain-containing protein n=1 Tax=Exophiala bonariae TaxID=1690606 RepID=A0AAV9MV40_9EURO|nr:hypothetical protein LTR84_009253 [Exophiala bonariae]